MSAWASQQGRGRKAPPVPLFNLFIIFGLELGNATAVLRNILSDAERGE